jgi:hypothetical protein
MSTLAEIQTQFRDAVIEREHGAIVSLAPVLTGGIHPEKRLAVHQRNFQQSLIDALIVKFPATGWLVGTPFLIEAAKHFIREHPPAAPCIAEYGSEFPAFLSQFPGAERAPYLEDFADLEWHVGQIAIAVDDTPINTDRFVAIDADDIPSTCLILQQGLRYSRAAWPVDELLRLYLTDAAPDRMELSPDSVWIEVRGSRGEFQMTRLDPAEFTFRKSIAEGLPIGEAAGSALDLDAAFEPGHALARLISSELITGITLENRRENP